MLMSLGHSSVNAQRDSLALDAKQVCLQTDCIQLTRQHGEITNDSFRLDEVFCVRCILRKLFLDGLIHFFFYSVANMSETIRNHP